MRNESELNDMNTAYSNVFSRKGKEYFLKLGTEKKIRYFPVFCQLFRKHQQNMQYLLLYGKR